jgi:hypothetical protein
MDLQERSGHMYGLIRAILVLYPLLTLALMLLAHSEMVVRKYMYYRWVLHPRCSPGSPKPEEHSQHPRHTCRTAPLKPAAPHRRCRLLSCGIILDFEQRPIWKIWFTYYFAICSTLVFIWTSYAAFVSSQRYSLNALTAWLIPNAQNLLLAKFYWCACCDGGHGWPAGSSISWIASPPIWLQRTLQQLGSIRMALQALLAGWRAAQSCAGDCASDAVPACVPAGTTSSAPSRIS